jgi:hypothetical protein
MIWSISPVLFRESIVRQRFFEGCVRELTDNPICNKIDPTLTT